ncbi:MAG TPA: hypothetical protein VMQ76_08420 [Terracidiphilus sp.]|nr:hypothetical protein [Terracidiphilus sp.]
MKSNLQSKLGAWALIAILMLGCTASTTGCSMTSNAQQIVNWTPVIDSALTELGGIASTLLPQDALIIQPLIAGLIVGQNLLSAQAKTYLANPGATTLQQLQAQALALQTNINAAVLASIRVSNPASQQAILTKLNAGLTGVSAILALIIGIKGSTLTPASVTAPKLSQVLPLLDERQSIALVAQHYGEPQFMAAYQVHRGESALLAAGL